MVDRRLAGNFTALRAVRPVGPLYLARLFDDLAELAGLHPGSRVLEIGCGTGQATLPLAQRGYCVTCVERGDALAGIARRNLTAFSDVEVVTSPFETWQPSEGDFDAVVAFTAFHWIDPPSASPGPPGCFASGVDSRWLPSNTFCRPAAMISSSTSRPITRRSCQTTRRPGPPGLPIPTRSRISAARSPRAVYSGTSRHADMCRTLLTDPRAWPVARDLLGPSRARCADSSRAARAYSRSHPRAPGRAGSQELSGDPECRGATLSGA